jgi:hypothetical protein
MIDERNILLERGPFQAKHRAVRLKSPCLYVYLYTTPSSLCDIDTVCTGVL